MGLVPLSLSCLICSHLICSCQFWSSSVYHHHLAPLRQLSFASKSSFIVDTLFAQSRRGSQAIAYFGLAHTQLRKRYQAPVRPTLTTVPLRPPCLLPSVRRSGSSPLLPPTTDRVSTSSSTSSRIDKTFNRPWEAIPSSRSIGAQFCLFALSWPPSKSSLQFVLPTSNRSSHLETLPTILSPMAALAIVCPPGNSLPSWKPLISGTPDFLYSSSRKPQVEHSKIVTLTGLRTVNALANRRRQVALVLLCEKRKSHTKDRKTPLGPRISVPSS